MTTKHDDGGPAKDATLWDEYAKAALQGYMAAAVSAQFEIETIWHVAADAADAMIAERRKRGIGT